MKDFKYRKVTETVYDGLIQSLFLLAISSISAISRPFPTAVSSNVGNRLRESMKLTATAFTCGRLAVYQQIDTIDSHVFWSADPTSEAYRSPLHPAPSPPSRESRAHLLSTCQRLRPSGAVNGNSAKKGNAQRHVAGNEQETNTLSRRRSSVREPASVNASRMGSRRHQSRQKSPTARKRRQFIRPSGFAYGTGAHVVPGSKTVGLQSGLRSSARADAATARQCPCSCQGPVAGSTEAAGLERREGHDANVRRRRYGRTVMVGTTRSTSSRAWTMIA
ncbi:hypothetical protein EDB84DRAFT_1520056 [Lactarius hengduanensis]|nr:hypothetical protein EDB84DRAFT_1520056 [Lactarius hengduanensis]